MKIFKRFYERFVDALAGAIVEKINIIDKKPEIVKTQPISSMIVKLKQPPINKKLSRKLGIQIPYVYMFKEHLRGNDIIERRKAIIEQMLTYIQLRKTKEGVLNLTTKRIEAVLNVSYSQAKAYVDDALASAEKSVQRSILKTTSYTYRNIRTGKIVSTKFVAPQYKPRNTFLIRNVGTKIHAQPVLYSKFFHYLNKNLKQNSDSGVAKIRVNELYEKFKDFLKTADINYEFSYNTFQRELPMFMKNYKAYRTKNSKSTRVVELKLPLN